MKDHKKIKISFKLAQDIPVLVEDLEEYDGLNKRILNDIEGMEYPLSYTTNVKAKMSTWSVRSPSLDDLKEIVDEYFVRAYQKHDGTPLYGDATMVHCDLWVARYDEDDHTLSHNHWPSTWSWVYFVKCPPGSSPLVIHTAQRGDEPVEIEAKEGRLVIFPSICQHSVPSNKCKDRVVVAANVVLCNKIVRDYILDRYV